MAPTEILARQHMAGLADMAGAAGVRMELLTGRDKGARRAQKLSDLQAGTIDILLGTHAVFQDGVHFKDLRLAVIDEQHRFGVAQRMALADKGPRVDVLVMTATPIPRSLELAQYGDMDTSILDEKPPGRKPITTAAMPMERLEAVVAKLRGAIAAGGAGVLGLPAGGRKRSDGPDIGRTAVSRPYAPPLATAWLGWCMGRCRPVEKDAAMAAFVGGDTKILVATTVIEVGVNVPNATIMVIERAEHFGLAQLHQLRGRVGRGTDASTCLLMYQPPLGESGERRLAILRETEDGFRIAEEDLTMRGAGDVLGTAQSGLPRFRVADLERQTALMALAQRDARLLLTTDPRLESPRGQAARTLLWLMEQDKALRFMDVG